AQDHHLAEVRHATLDQLGLTERGTEKHDHYERGHDREKHRLGEPERADGEERLPFKILQARGGEPAPAEEVATPAGKGAHVTGHRLSPSVLARGVDPPEPPRSWGETLPPRPPWPPRPTRP